ncbi:ABC-2 type transporter-domain-containing protein [Aspergillus spectabilis]
MTSEFRSVNDHDIECLADLCGTILEKSRASVPDDSFERVGLLSFEVLFRIWCRRYDARPSTWQSRYPWKNPESLPLDSRLSDQKLIDELKRRLQCLAEYLDERPDNAYAASCLYQFQIITRRALTNYWRDPDYVLGKIQLNIWMGLVNGITFLQLSNDLAGARGRMFSLFVGEITGPVLSLQIKPRFIILRDQFLARENESHVYYWAIFTISAIVVEIPFTLLGGLLGGLIYWLLWYCIVGYSYLSTRAGYAFLMYELCSLFVTSLSQLTASLFPTVLAAQTATGFIWLVMNTFNGPLSPPPLTTAGWRWFYNISPLFYFIEGLGTNAMHGVRFTCANEELSIFHAPAAETCASYAAEFFNMSTATGYLINPEASGQCEYCTYADGDEYVRSSLHSALFFIDHGY